MEEKEVVLMGKEKEREIKNGLKKRRGKRMKGKEKEKKRGRKKMRKRRKRRGRGKRRKRRRYRNILGHVFSAAEVFESFSNLDG